MLGPGSIGCVEGRSLRELAVQGSTRAGSGSCLVRVSRSVLLDALGGPVLHELAAERSTRAAYSSGLPPECRELLRLDGLAGLDVRELAVQGSTHAMSRSEPGPSAGSGFASMRWDGRAAVSWPFKGRHGRLRARSLPVRALRWPRLAALGWRGLLELAVQGSTRGFGLRCAIPLLRSASPGCVERVGSTRVDR